MNEMPYRHVEPPAGWSPGGDSAALATALEAGDVDAALGRAAAIGPRIGSATGDADALAAIEHLVRAIARNRRALLSLRAIAPELRRAVKNPWRTHGVRVDPAAAVAELSGPDVRSVRVDPALRLTLMTDGVLGRGRLAEGALVFAHAGRITARVEGPEERLRLLAALVDGARLTPGDLSGMRMPADLDAFAAHVERRQDQVDGLLETGRRLVEGVERLVCRLYGLSEELTELVIESAVARAGTVAQADE